MTPPPADLLEELPKRQGRPGDWLNVPEELLRRLLLGTHFSEWKAAEGGHERRILLLARAANYEPAIGVAPRSTSPNPRNKGIEHVRHSHHPRAAATRHGAVEEGCQLDADGFIVEYFSADADLLFSEPPAWSCTEPDWPRLRSDLRRRGWIDD